MDWSGKGLCALGNAKSLFPDENMFLHRVLMGTTPFRHVDGGLVVGGEGIGLSAIGWVGVTLPHPSSI